MRNPYILTDVLVESLGNNLPLVPKHDLLKRIKAGETFQVWLNPLNRRGYHPIQIGIQFVRTLLWIRANDPDWYALLCPDSTIRAYVYNPIDDSKELETVETRRRL